VTRYLGFKPRHGLTQCFRTDHPKYRVTVLVVGKCFAYRLSKNNMPDGQLWRRQHLNQFNLDPFGIVNYFWDMILVF
jgi:hypothetical protein